MPQPHVITIAREKGGVGKTTVAINLAIFLKALREDLPVTLLSFDNHFSVDRMFRIGARSRGRHVGDLFAGVPPEDLTETGEFGVQFVPSYRELDTFREHLASPTALAEALSKSHLGGILIIDTRPDLDLFTRNAICAADRVIIPVKDTPSLENCRHLFSFADQMEIPRHRLRVLPCLIDFRIQYAGPFKNPHQLMKAYAINRGYKCLEQFISKSPKVESLNTNPEGRIFPVLTYGRGTDVHQQFTALAESVLGEVDAAPAGRLAEVAARLAVEGEHRQRAYEQRLQQLEAECPCCTERLVADNGILPGAAFYLESSDGGLAAFLHEPCANRLLFSQLFEQGATQIPSPMQELLHETYRRSYFVVRRTPGTRGYVVPQLSLYRFDDQGLEMSRQDTTLEEMRPLNRGIEALITRALPETRDGHEPFLLVRRVCSDMPDSILMPENHQQLERVRTQIKRQFPRD